MLSHAPPVGSASTPTTSPTPSTWPCTRWPPNRVARVTGRSRFTGSPGERPERLVRRTVSSDRSNPRWSGPRSTTVRHTPFTAIDEPTSLSASTVRQDTVIRSGARSTTAPSSSTIPVNMGLHPQVLPYVVEGRDGELHGLGDGGEPPSAQDTGRVLAPNELGGEVHHDLVHGSVLDHGPRERGAAFQEDALYVPLAQVREELSERHPPALGLVLDDLGPPGPPGLPTLAGSQARGGDHGGCGRVEQVARLRDPSPGVHEDPEGGTPRVSGIPDGERRIVHQRRPRSDHDGVGGGPEPMDIRTGRLAGDPS